MRAILKILNSNFVRSLCNTTNKEFLKSVFSEWSLDLSGSNIFPALNQLFSPVPVLIRSSIMEG